MTPHQFGRMLLRVQQLTDMTVGELRDMAVEDEPMLPGMDHRSKGECVARIVDREFYNTIGVTEDARRSKERASQSIRDVRRKRAS